MPRPLVGMTEVSQVTRGAYARSSLVSHDGVRALSHDRRIEMWCQSAIANTVMRLAYIFLNRPSWNDRCGGCAPVTHVVD